MGSQLTGLSVRIVRFVDSYQPGTVAREFVDAEGRRHTFMDKVPIFTTEQLDARSKYPQPGTIRCTVLNSWRDAQGRKLVVVSTLNPDGVESVGGLGEFVVEANRVSAVPDSESQ